MAITLAKSLFKEIRSSDRQEVIAEYLRKIDARSREVLSEAVDNALRQLKE